MFKVQLFRDCSVPLEELDVGMEVLSPDGKSVKITEIKRGNFSIEIRDYIDPDNIDISEHVDEFLFGRRSMMCETDSLFSNVAFYKGMQLNHDVSNSLLGKLSFPPRSRTINVEVWAAEDIVLIDRSIIRGFKTDF